MARTHADAGSIPAASTTNSLLLRRTFSRRFAPDRLASFARHSIDPTAQLSVAHWSQSDWPPRPGRSPQASACEPYREWIEAGVRQGRTRPLAPNPIHATLKYMLNYSEPAQRLFQALADPTRLAIFEQLSRGPASVSELAEPLPMSMPGVLQHLAVLEDRGLVHSEKVGRVRTCRIEPAALEVASDWVAERRAMCERSFDRLGDFLAEQKVQ